MISVLLATYNGARWLPQFLDSLQAQTVTDWQLLVRDDGSTDATGQIIADAAAAQRRITLVESRHGLGKSRGAKDNFGALMQYARQLAPTLDSDSSQTHYFAFADQDDVWLPHKLATQQTLLAEMESSLGPQTPLLVHSDLTVVDEQLRVLHPSHTALARLHRDCPAEDALRTLLAHNFVTGCTMLFNRALLSAATPVPDEAILHDGWTALCAAALGRIAFLREPTVLYRQHGANAVGARRDWLRLLSWRAAGQRASRNAAQAGALRQRLRDLDCDDAHPACAVLDQYAELFKQSNPRWRRFHDAYRLGIGRPGAVQRLLYAAQAAMATSDELRPSP